MGGTGAGPHSAAELNEAATRAEALCDAPAVKAKLARFVDVLFRS